MVQGPFSTIRRGLFAACLGLAASLLGFAPVAADDEKKDDAKKEQKQEEAKAAEPSLPKFAPKKQPGTLAPVFSKRAPENIEDLEAVQEQVNKTYEKIKRSVVCLRFGSIVGSGVIVTTDGYVLTAGHVSAGAHRPVTMIFYDGKSAKGTTLGGNHGIDSGMAKINEGEWQPVEIGDSSQVKVGQWVFVCSHPGGYRQGRTPPVRVGRVQGFRGSQIETDCTMVGGDSGGPLFDMHGRVIGINSNIGQSITQNRHVMTNPFVQSWDRLAKGEVFRGAANAPSIPAKAPPAGVYLGVQPKFADEQCTIEDVVKDSPAAKAGLKPMDVILQCDGTKISTKESFVNALSKKKVGDEIRIEVRRGEEMLTMTATLAKRTQ